MPTSSNPPITSAKLLLDSEYRLIAIGDAQGLLTPPPAQGQPLSDYWVNFEPWLALYRAVDPDRNNFQICIPGTMASLTPLGEHQLMHVWKHLDVLQSSLSLLQFNALVFDANQTLVYANTAAQSFLSSLGLRDWETLLPERWHRHFTDWLQQDVAINLERELEGMRLRWEITSDPNQQFVVMVCHPMEEHENYRRILEYSVDGIYQTDAQGAVIYANYSLARLFLYESPADMKEQIREAAHDIYVHPGDRARFLEALAQTNEISGFECQMKRKNGELIWVRQNARRVVNEQGELVHIIGTIADISELKRSEEARRNAESDYEDLFNTAQAGLYQSTISGTFIRVNHLFARTLACASREECLAYYDDITQKLYDSPRQRLRLLSMLQRDRTVVNQRARMVRRDGKPIWVLMNAQYVTERHTGREVIQGSIIDITEQVDAENEIRCEGTQGMGLSGFMRVEVG